MTVALLSANRDSTGWLLARELGFPVLAVAVIVVSADIRIPMGLPGHRGLVWLSLLVAVALLTRRRETVVAVGAAAPIHLVALAGSVAALLGGGYLSALVSVGMVEKVLFHLGFGLLAGLLGLAAAFGMDCVGEIRRKGCLS